MSERRAFVCQHEKCKPPVRIFAADEKKPECPEHGRTMKAQPNRVYHGKGQ